jgi:hypothetical protein
MFMRHVNPRTLGSWAGHFDRSSKNWQYNAYRFRKSNDLIGEARF